MIKFKERKKRFFEEIEQKSELFKLLKTRFSDKPLKIKYDLEEREIYLSNFDEAALSVDAKTHEGYKTGADNMIICSALLDKYFEVELEVAETLSPGHFHCTIHGGRRATSGRADIRFRVKPGDVYVTNFRVSKHSIDLSLFKLPTSIKVILDQFQVQNRSRYEQFEVGYFDKTDTVLNQMKKTGCSLFIEDLADSDNYVPITEDFIDIKDLLPSERQSYISQYKEHKYKSIMMVPVVYLTPNEQSIPFAYLKILTKSRALTMDDYIKMKEDSFKLVDRIRDANTEFVEKKQAVIDISRGGAKLCIDDPDLKKYLIKTKGFIFDIVFRLQQPITIYGEVKFTGVNDNKDLILGLSFSGNTSRKNQMRHLYAVLKPMEVQYKKKLIEQIKKKQQQAGG